MPPCLKYTGFYSKPDIWAATLHLIYNAALIVLHSHMHSSSFANHMRTEDTNICNNAAISIEQVSRLLSDSCQMPYLQSIAVFCLSSALTQLTLNTRASNPVLAVSYLKRYDSVWASIRRLSVSWPTAGLFIKVIEP